MKNLGKWTFTKTSYVNKLVNKQKICPHMFKRLGWWRLWSGFWGGRFKVSQLLGITTTIASLDTYEGSTKSVQIVSLRRWLNGDGWGVGAKVLTVSKVSRIWELSRITIHTAHGGSWFIQLIWIFCGTSWTTKNMNMGHHEYDMNMNFDVMNLCEYE